MMNKIKFLLLLVFLIPASVSAAETALIEQMRSGNAVLMIRHALAPGFGDPDEFKLGDCSTQRNLDDEGREQAVAIGEWLRARDIKNVKVYSSQWCRCLDTARLMEMGDVIPLPALNSVHGRPEEVEPTTQAVTKFIHDNTKPGELIIMVTHQANIRELIHRGTDSGHGKLLQPGPAGDIRMLGEIEFQE